MNAHARVMAVTVAPRAAQPMHFGAHPIATPLRSAIPLIEPNPLKSRGNSAFQKPNSLFCFAAAPLCFEGERVHTVTASSHYLYTHAPEPFPSVWGQDRL